MSELAGFGTDWLPASVQRRIAAEERQDAQRDREASRDREAQAEAAHDRAVASYMAGAAVRGEDVGAMDAVAGNVGRTLAEVLAGPMSEVADRVPKEHREPVVLVHPPARRSAPADPDGVIDRAALAAEARRLDRRGKAAADAMDAAAARRGPGTLADAWASWRQR